MLLVILIIAIFQYMGNPGIFKTIIFQIILIFLN